MVNHPKAERAVECALIRQTLTELELMHYRYCFHAHVTKCVCEEYRLETMCDIRCTQLLQQSTGETLRAPVMLCLLFILLVIERVPR